MGYNLGTGWHGPISLSLKSVSADYVIDPTSDCVIGVNHLGPITLYLPKACCSVFFVIKDESGLADHDKYLITVSPTETTINKSSASLLITKSYGSIKIYGSAAGYFTW